MNVRLCDGPSHERPVWLPLTDEHWHFYRSGVRKGRVVNHCKSCRHLERVRLNGPGTGLVPTEELLPWVKELTLRCETISAVERMHGISSATLYAIVHKEHGLVQKRTAARVLGALVRQRRHDREHGTSESFRDALRARAQRTGLLEQRMKETYGF